MGGPLKVVERGDRIKQVAVVTLRVERVRRKEGRKKVSTTRRYGAKVIGELRRGGDGEERGLSSNRGCCL